MVKISYVGPVGYGHPMIIGNSPLVTVTLPYPTRDRMSNFAIQLFDMACLKNWAPPKPQVYHDTTTGLFIFWTNRHRNRPKQTGGMTI